MSFIAILGDGNVIHWVAAIIFAVLGCIGGAYVTRGDMLALLGGFVGAIAGAMIGTGVGALVNAVI